MSNSKPLGIGGIIIEDINDKYARGKYGSFHVLIMKDNCYINATKLCKDAGKEYRFWFVNSTSKELINAVSASVNIL